jgi:invasion protein IalB
MVLDNFLFFQSRFAVLLLGALLAAFGLPPLARAEDTPSAWRVECVGDGKTLDCRAIQQMINRDDKQLVLLLSARVPADTKAPVLLLQLPLGISLTEPVQLKVDNGSVEREPVQTCTNVGCIVSVPLKDPLLAAMRSGTLLKVSIQDASKRTINIDVPLLGFGLALDKAK